MRKIILAAVLAAGFAAGAAAQTPEEVARQTSTPGFSDPSFQDFVETVYGYMSPGNRPAALRDAVASSSVAVVPAPAARAAYVFVSILPRDADYSALLRDLSSSAAKLRPLDDARFALVSAQLHDRSIDFIDKFPRRLRRGPRPRRGRCAWWAGPGPTR